MHYFMSDIHGAEDAYHTIKDRIGFKTNDELYILGGVLDGNKRDPGACLRILDDIIAHDNIHLVLGKNEYAHVMNQLYTNEIGEDNEWRDFLLQPDINGGFLVKYFSTLEKSKRDRYIAYLLECELSDMIKIGSKYFYLVHGAPAMCVDNNISAWQSAVSMGIVDLQKRYDREIASDPNLDKDTKNNIGNTIVIAGHQKTKEYFESDDELMAKYYKDPNVVKSQRVIMHAHKMLINCGCTGDSYGKVCNGWIPDLACVGVDAAGFFVEYAKSE